jgi:hypothetical protein
MSLYGPPAPQTPPDGPTSSSDGRTSRPLWTSPQAHDTTKGDPARVRRYGTKHGAANLTDDVAKITGKKRLNPLFVEWLMGLPQGWTAFAPLETPSSRQRRSSPLERLSQDISEREGS